MTSSISGTPTWKTLFRPRSGAQSPGRCSQGVALGFFMSPLSGLREERNCIIRGFLHFTPSLGLGGETSSLKPLVGDAIKKPWATTWEINGAE